MLSPSPGLIVARSSYDQIVDQALSSAPLEVCGFLGGRGGYVYGVFPVPNVAPRPSTAFLMEGQAQLAAMAEIENRGWKIVAIYHSHPPGERTYPSLTDVEQASYPEVLHVIIVPSWSGSVISTRVFCIAEGNSTLVPLRIMPCLISQ